MLKPITIILAITKEDCGPLIERADIHVIARAFDTDDEAIEALAEHMTAESYADHNEHYVADVENGPCEDDIPMTWTAEGIKEHYYVRVHQAHVLA